MTATDIYSLDEARVRFARRLVIELDQSDPPTVLTDLKSALRPSPNGLPVVVCYQAQGAQAEITFGDEWRIDPTDAALRRLGKIAGDKRVRLVYSV